jgi:hypothetical protein
VSAGAATGLSNGATVGVASLERAEVRRERYRVREEPETSDIGWIGSFQTLSWLYIWNLDNWLPRLLWALVLLEAIVIYCPPPKMYLWRRFL